jgi:hypothetical protein
MARILAGTEPRVELFGGSREDGEDETGSGEEGAGDDE